MTTNKGMLFSVKKTQNNEVNSLDLTSEEHLKTLCDELTDTRSLDDFKQQILKIVTAMGFTDYLFVRLERAWHSHSHQGLLYSYPKELMRVYHESAMYTGDLMIPYGKTNTQPIFSSQVYGYIDNAPFEIEFIQKNRALCQLYRRFSYFEHYVTPMHAFNGNGNVQLILTSRDLEKDKFQSMVVPVMPLCRYLCKAIDSVSTKNFRSAFIDTQDNPINITPKPLRILNRLANHDISITDLAKEMCISPITAHQHIAAARKALGVQTNIAAVVKAFKAGLITIE